MRRTGPVVALLLSLAAGARAAEPVSVTDDGLFFTLKNGIVTAKVVKDTGNLGSLEYNGIEILAGNVQRPAGYWSHNARTRDPADRMAKVTIDPKNNDGERAEVSVKGLCKGGQMGAGSPGGGAIADIEIRYTLERGLSGLYTWSIWEHTQEHPYTNVGEARFLLKLNDRVFDWMTVDAQRNFKSITAKDWNYGTPLNMKEVRRINTGDMKGRIEHKYDYSANQFDVLAWGWSSTSKNIGCWFINPTIEYLSGGPTKIELSAHRDATFTPQDKEAPAPPCLLNYWRGSHYGSTNLAVGQGEQWTKVIGPFLIYCNAGNSPDALRKDALARVPVEQKAWPYDWAKHAAYATSDQRATVQGKLTLQNDPDVGTPLANLLVGLTVPEYLPPAVGGRAGRGFGGPPRPVNWQNDAKNYQFWTRANPDGTFTIPAVRPGKYVLHAFASGFLGEFVKADITVEPGKPLDLGTLAWTPKRFGRTLWEIGIPDRSAAEFFKGDKASSWGLYLQYARDFPNDVTFTVGKSDFRKDWFLMQVPHNEDPANVDGKGNGRATPWHVKFSLDHAPKGKATLRLAFAGTETRSLALSINGKELPPLTGFLNTSSIHRDSATSYFQTRDVSFDATALKEGDNDLTLTVPTGSLASGVMYDYLRLELDEAASN